MVKVSSAMQLCLFTLLCLLPGNVSLRFEGATTDPSLECVHCHGKNEVGNTNMGLRARIDRLQNKLLSQNAVAGAPVWAAGDDVPPGVRGARRRRHKNFPKIVEQPLLAAEEEAPRTRRNLLSWITMGLGGSHKDASRSTLAPAADEMIDVQDNKPIGKKESKPKPKGKGGMRKGKRAPKSAPSPSDAGDDAGGGNTVEEADHLEEAGLSKPKPKGKGGMRKGKRAPKSAPSPSDAGDDAGGGNTVVEAGRVEEAGLSKPKPKPRRGKKYWQNLENSGEVNIMADPKMERSDIGGDAEEKHDFDAPISKQRPRGKGRRSKRGPTIEHVSAQEGGPLVPDEAPEPETVKAVESVTPDPSETQQLSRSGGNMIEEDTVILESKKDERQRKNSDKKTSTTPSASKTLTSWKSWFLGGSSSSK